MYRKHLAGSSLVKEEITLPNSPSGSESSMDSTTNRFGLDSTTNATTVLPSPIKKILKMENNSSNPPSSTREALRN